MTGSVYIRLVPFVLWAIAAGCGGTSGDADATSTPTGPSPGSSNDPGCTTRVTGVPSSIPTEGGRFAFTITTAAACGWTARADAAWADVAPGTGQGSATPMLTVAANTRTDTRSLTVTVNGQSFQAVQNPAQPPPVVVCSYVVDPTTLEEGPDAGTAETTLTTFPGCPWTATASESWIQVLTRSGTGSARIKIEVAQNKGSARHAFLTVAGQRVNVTQRGQ